jgi:hypothetical protein
VKSLSITHCLEFVHCVRYYNSHDISAADSNPVIRFHLVAITALHIAKNVYCVGKVITSNDHGVVMHLNRYHWSINIFC